MLQLYASLLYIGSSTTGGGTVDTTQDSSNIIIGVVIGFIVPIMVIVTITVSVIIWKRYELHCYNFSLLPTQFLNKEKKCNILTTSIVKLADDILWGIEPLLANEPPLCIETSHHNSA